MTSHKSRNDEIYEQGVHDGQEADTADQIVHGLVKGYTLDPRTNSIYNKGYEYGVAHQPQPELFRAGPDSTSVGTGGGGSPALSGATDGAMGVLAGIPWIIGALWGLTVGYGEGGMLGAVLGFALGGAFGLLVGAALLFGLVLWAMIGLFYAAYWVLSLFL